MAEGKCDHVARSIRALLDLPRYVVAALAQKSFHAPLEFVQAYRRNAQPFARYQIVQPVDQ